MKHMMHRVPWDRNGYFAPLFLALLLSFLPVWQDGPVGAILCAADERPDEDVEGLNLSTESATNPQHRGRGPASPLIIDNRLRDNKQIPLLFRQVQEDPERFFYLEPDLLRIKIETSLNQNPGLKAVEAEWQALLKKARRISALPDPNLVVTAFLEGVQTRVGPQDVVLSLTQKLPWFGKLSSAELVVMEQALEKAWQWRALQRETVFLVKKAFYNIIYLGRALDITDEDLSMLQGYEAIALTRYATGKGSQQNVIKVQSEIARLNERRIILRRQRDSGRSELARRLGSPMGEITDWSAVRCRFPLVTVQLDDLYETVSLNREELQARHHALRARQEEVRLARKQYWPDMTMGFNYIVVGERNDPAGILNPPQGNGQDAYGFLAGINLPVWYPKFRAGVEEARLKEYQAKKDYYQEENRLIHEIQDAYIRLDSIHDQLDLYQTALIPQAMQSRDASEAAYKPGTTTLLELLDSERYLLNVRYGHEKIKSDYLTALAGMERALGIRFPEPAGHD